MMAHQNDKELIERAQSGDERAFEALLLKYYDVMFRIAFKWRRNRADAEDITQNACIKLARNINSFNFRSAFTSWLYRMVINTAIDWQRQNSRHQAYELTDNPGHDCETDAMENALYAKQVLQQVQTLPGKEKTALLLVMSEGLTHKETAAIMECKESTVSWYIHEARKKLDNFEERRHG